MRGIVIVLVIVCGTGLLGWWYWRSQQPKNLIDTKNFYDLSIMDIDNNKLSFSTFIGKKVLIVNIASHCGFTPQLASLQNLYELYQDRLIVVAIPCDQFFHQTPGNASEIKSFCEKNYAITFLLTEKVFVTGPDQHPVYQRLTHQSLNGIKNTLVKRNFQKYLIDENGKLLDVFAPTIEPFDVSIVSYIKSVHT